MLNTFESQELTYINKVMPEEVDLILIMQLKALIAGPIQRMCTTQFAHPTLRRKSGKYKRLN